MRLQLALNVRDIDEAVAYYTKLFATEPHKQRPGYANFEIASPPLKLVLFEDANAALASGSPTGSRNANLTSAWKAPTAAPCAR